MSKFCYHFVRIFCYNTFSYLNHLECGSPPESITTKWSSLFNFDGVDGKFFTSHTIFYSCVDPNFVSKESLAQLASACKSDGNWSKIEAPVCVPGKIKRIGILFCFNFYSAIFVSFFVLDLLARIFFHVVTIRLPFFWFVCYESIKNFQLAPDCQK